MATKQKTKIGHMPCLCCGEKIPVKAAENGTLNISCPECDFTGYLRHGTDAHRKVSGRITKISATPPVGEAGMQAGQGLEHAPASKVPAAKQTPAPVRRQTIFG